MGRYGADHFFVKDEDKKEVAAKYLKDTICNRNLRKVIDHDF
jgi:hypothetical protein